MGICRHQFYFKKELPKIQEIKNKFHEITGLNLQYCSIAHLSQLMRDTDDILYHLKKSGEQTDFVVINPPYFSCSGFNNVYLGEYMRPETRTFDIECDIKTENMYFFWALTKTMLEIGGNISRKGYYPYKDYPDMESYSEPYIPHERIWKRIKKWDEMSDVEKAVFNGKYSK